MYMIRGDLTGQTERNQGTLSRNESPEDQVIVQNSPKSLVYRFDVFELDAVAGQLRKHGHKLRLAGQPIEILTLLLERQGEVVSREEIQQRLWSQETFVDFENSLNKAISSLRQALSDSSGQPVYIGTLPRRGYRFLWTGRAR